MPTTVFDWIVRTAMLAMAGLVTLSILGAIATMTEDAGSGFAGGNRPIVEGEPAQEPEAAQAPSPPSAPGEGNAAAPAPGRGEGGTIVAARPEPEDKTARWLEAIAYALIALVGVGALAVLMLLSILRELRRRG